MLETVAQSVIRREAQVVKDLPASENSAQPNCIGVHGAIFYEFNTASIGCDVAADVAWSFGAQIEWHEVSEVFYVLLESLEDAASLAFEDSTSRVEWYDFVHFLQWKNNFLLGWNASSNQAGVAPLRH